MHTQAFCHVKVFILNTYLFFPSVIKTDRNSIVDRNLFYTNGKLSLKSKAEIPFFSFLFFRYLKLSPSCFHHLLSFALLCPSLLTSTPIAQTLCQALCEDLAHIITFNSHNNPVRWIEVSHHLYRRSH